MQAVKKEDRFMSGISKGDFVLVPREYAESALNNYRMCKVPGKDVIIVTPENEGGKEDSTLLFVDSCTDKTVVLAVPVFEGLDYNFTLVNKRAVSLDSLERSGYKKCNADIPTMKLRELKSLDKRKTILRSIVFLLAVFALAAVVTVITVKSCFHLGNGAVACITAAELAFLFPLSLWLQKKIIINSYIQKRTEIIQRFHSIQKEYRFFYYAEKDPSLRESTV